MSGPTIPTAPAPDFAGPLLSHLEPQLLAVLPYAAAFTALWLAVQFIEGWIGRRNALHAAEVHKARYVSDSEYRAAYDRRERSRARAARRKRDKHILAGGR